jgi:subtilase family serine protease
MASSSSNTPDLIVSSATSSSSVVTQGNNFLVDFQLKNVGSSSAAANWLGAYVDGILMDTNNYSYSIAAGTSFWDTVEFSTATLSAGLHQLMIKTDAGDSVVESDDSNNETFLEFTVQATSQIDIYPQPDLAIAYSLPNSLVMQGSPLSFDLITMNMNTGNSPWSVDTA